MITSRLSATSVRGLRQRNCNLRYMVAHLRVQWTGISKWTKRHLGASRRVLCLVRIVNGWFVCWLIGGWLVSWLVGPSIGLLVDRSVVQLVGCSVGRSFVLFVFRSVCQSVGMFVGRSMVRLVGWSAGRSFDQLVDRSVGWLVSRSFVRSVA